MRNLSAFTLFIYELMCSDPEEAVRDNAMKAFQYIIDQEFLRAVAIRADLYIQLSSPLLAVARAKRDNHICWRCCRPSQAMAFVFWVFESSAARRAD